MSFENRPELMVAAFGFGSFLCINKNNNSNLMVMLAGVLAALAMLSHLNGVIYIVAGMSTLLFIKRYNDAVLFSIASGVTGSLYFFDVILTENGFAIWYFQFRNDPAVQSAFNLNSKLYILLTFPKLFFESPEQVALSLLLLFLLWTQRKIINRLPKMLTMYSIFLVISFWLITKKNSGIYMVLFMPFMFALVYNLYKLHPFKNLGIKIVLTIYLFIGLYGIIEIIVFNVKHDYLPDTYQELRTFLPKGEKNVRGLVPMTYFFNEYEQYSNLVSYENFFFTSDSSTSSEDLAKWAKSREIDFRVVAIARKTINFEHEYFIESVENRASLA